MEEWHFKDAVRTSDGILYHGDCRKEAKDSEVSHVAVQVETDVINVLVGPNDTCDTSYKWQLTSRRI